MARNRSPGGREGPRPKPPLNEIEPAPVTLALPEYVDPADTRLAFWWNRWAPLAIKLGTLNDFTLDSFVDFCRCQATIERLNAELLANTRDSNNADRIRSTLRVDLRGHRGELANHKAAFGMTPAAVLKAGAVRPANGAPGRGHLERVLPAIEQAQIEAEMQGWQPPELKVAEG